MKTALAKARPNVMPLIWARWEVYSQHGQASKGKGTSSPIIIKLTADDISAGWTTA
jgi:hypothetical protein